MQLFSRNYEKVSSEEPTATISISIQLWINRQVVIRDLPKETLIETIPEFFIFLCNRNRLWFNVEE